MNRSWSPLPPPRSRAEKMRAAAECGYQYCTDQAVTYETLTYIGAGTFGQVSKAQDRKTKSLVAIKKTLMANETEGLPTTAMREIKILQILKHDNIVNLIEVCRSQATAYNQYRSTFYLIFEFCNHDLAGMLRHGVQFSLGDIKSVVKQLFSGLYFIHYNRILHRDIKPANILMNKTGVLKIADFGLARAFSHAPIGLTNRFAYQVVTLWYRAPELLLGEKNHGPEIDLWAAGCIMAELWTRNPLIQGQTEEHQLELICNVCGSINPDVWPGVEKLEGYKSRILPQGLKRKVSDRVVVHMRNKAGMDLIDQLFTLDPKRRMTADAALDHEFFWTNPEPADLSKLLSKYDQSMFEGNTSSRKGQNGGGAVQPPQGVQSSHRGGGGHPQQGVQGSHHGRAGQPPQGMQGSHRGQPQQGMQCIHRGQPQQGMQGSHRGQPPQRLHGIHRTGEVVRAR